MSGETRNKYRLHLLDRREYTVEKKDPYGQMNCDTLKIMKLGIGRRDRVQTASHFITSCLVSSFSLIS